MIGKRCFQTAINQSFHLNLMILPILVFTTFNKMMVLSLLQLCRQTSGFVLTVGFLRSKIKEYVTKEITHSALTTEMLIIKYRARRHKCPCCGKTYYEFKSLLSSNPRKYRFLLGIIFLKDLKDFNETFTSVARRYNCFSNFCIHYF